MKQKWTLSTFRSKLFNQYNNNNNSSEKKSFLPRYFNIHTWWRGQSDVPWLCETNTHTTAEKMVMLLFGVNALSTKSYTLFTMVRNFSFRFWFYFCRRFFFFTLSSSSSSSSSILVSNCKSRFFFLSRLKQRVNKRGRKCGHRVNESRKQSSILTYRIDVWHRR